MQMQPLSDRYAPSPLLPAPLAAIIQKRLKKEKKAKRKLQEALEYESKRREQAEQTLKQPSPADSMRSLNGQTTLHAATAPQLCSVYMPLQCRCRSSQCSGT